MSEATPTDNGGYDYDFVDRPDKRYDIICNICHLPSRDPYMTGECCRGQIICKSCLDKFKALNVCKVALFVAMKSLLHTLTFILIERSKASTFTVPTNRKVVNGRVN